MTSAWSVPVLIFAGLISAVIGGVFLAFSDFIMRSLHKAQRTGGIESMQIINREVYRSVFMVLLVGMSAVSALIAMYALVYASGAMASRALAGGLLYLIGVFGVTLGFNVPMNKRLDVLDFTGLEAASYWAHTFYPKWTFWNYVRSIAAMLSGAFYISACF